MEVVEEGFYQGGGQVGFEAKLRFGHRIGSRIDSDKSKDEIDPDVATKLSLWKRFRRNNMRAKKDPLSSLRKMGSMRSYSTTTSASSEASRSFVPDWNIGNAIPNERDVNSPRVFQGTYLNPTSFEPFDLCKTCVFSFFLFYSLHILFLVLFSEVPRWTRARQHRGHSISVGYHAHLFGPNSHRKARRRRFCRGSSYGRTTRPGRRWRNDRGRGALWFPSRVRDQEGG